MKKTSLLREFLWQRRSILLYLLLLECLGSALSLLLPILVAQTYAAIFEFQSMRGRYLQQLGFGANSVPQWLMVLGVAILCKAGFDYFRKSGKGRLMEDFLFWLRQKLFIQHLHMHTAAYEKTGTSKYLMRFSGDLSSAQQVLGKGILQFVADLSLLFLGALLLLWLNWQLGLLVLGMSTLAALLIGQLNRQLEKVEERRRDSKASLLSFVNQRLSHIYTLKAFNRHTPELNQFSKKARKIQTLGAQYQRQVARLNALVPLFIYLILLLVLSLVYFWKEQGLAFSQELLFALILILLTWKPVLSRVMQVGLVWKKGGISLRKISTLLENPLEPGLDLTKREFRAKTLRVHCQNETELSFILQSGQRHGAFLHATQQQNLVKSLALLRNDEDVEIYLDEHSYIHLSPQAIRRQLSFVSPLFPLYGKDILEAVAFSNKHRGKAQQLFLEWQKLFPELQNLSIATPISERNLLTPAQTQLLQWLRAFLLNKPFLILHNAYLHLSMDNIQQLEALLYSQKPDLGILVLQSE